MANIVITSDTTFINIEFNDYSNLLEGAAIKKTCINSFDRESGYVKINYLGGNVLLTSSSVDTVDGNSVSDNDDLYDKLKALI